jgi:hypothetical protein
LGEISNDFYIPKGITDGSPGSSRDRDDHWVQDKEVILDIEWCVILAQGGAERVRLCRRNDNVRRPARLRLCAFLFSRKPLAW